MKYAFLFLTYDNILFEEEILKLIDNNNIYIHPKYPNKVHNSISKYIIKNLVQTKWAECSIVDATINLLREAYNNIENEWFILLSSDTYPLHTNKQFYKKFEKFQKDNNNKSIFSYNNKYKDYYKTSQWWIIKRADVNIILNAIQKYKHRFKDLGIQGACDEFYFLSILMWEIPNYEYIDMQSIHTRFLKNTLSKHPLMFNKLTPVDTKILKESKSFFIRKVTSNFQIKSIKLHKILYVLTIGLYTNQNDILKFINKNIKHMDFILFVLIDDLNNIFIDIKNSVLYIYLINFKYYYDTIISLCITEQNILKQWNNNIFFIPEIYDFKLLNLQNISLQFNTINISKYCHYIIKNNNYIKQIKDLKFLELKDNKNNIALKIYI